MINYKLSQKLKLIKNYKFNYNNMPKWWMVKSKLENLSNIKRLLDMSVDDGNILINGKMKKTQ